MSRCAIVDIGSNTVKLSVFEEDGRLSFYRSVPVGLMGYLEGERLREAGVARLIEVLTSFETLARQNGALSLFPFATAALRQAGNREAVCAAVKEKTGLTIRLLSGEEEAACSLSGALFASGLSLTDALYLDLGGGSCEAVLVEQKVCRRSVSLPLGALSLHRAYVKNILPSRSEARRIGAFARKLFKEAGIGGPFAEAVTVGGSAKAMVALHAHLTRRSPALPYTFSAEELCALRDSLTDPIFNTKLALLTLCPERIHTMPAALCAYASLLPALKIPRLTVAEGSAREGYFLRLRDSGALSTDALPTEHDLPPKKD